MNEKYKEVILENQSKIGKSFDFYDELENRNPKFYKWDSQTAITYLCELYYRNYNFRSKKSITKHLLSFFK